jgi:hypothetical protein
MRFTKSKALYTTFGRRLFMGKVLRFLTVCAGGMVLAIGMAAASAGIAAAQASGAKVDSGAHGNGRAPAVAQPAAVSAADFSGCWDGTSSFSNIADNWQPGGAIGWIGIIQKGKNIKGGKKGSYYEIVWNNGDYAYGPVTGKADSDGFAATGKAGGKCKVQFVASPDNSGNIVGTYGFANCGSFDYHSGTFIFALDNSGCADIIP